MKIALIASGVIALLLNVIGGILSARATKREDADKQAKAAKISRAASLFWVVFFILLIVLVIQVLFFCPGLTPSAPPCTPNTT